MLMVSDDPEEQARFETSAKVFGPHFAYGLTMAGMSLAEAEAFIQYVTHNDLIQEEPARALDLYYGLPEEPDV